LSDFGSVVNRFGKKWVLAYLSPRLVIGNVQ
jgi:hypothetical protein